MAMHSENYVVRSTVFCFMLFIWCQRETRQIYGQNTPTHVSWRKYIFLFLFIYMAHWIHCREFVCMQNVVLNANWCWIWSNHHLLQQTLSLTHTCASIRFVFAKRQCAECWLCCSSAQIVGCFAPRVFIAFRIIFQYQLSFSVVSPHFYLFFALMSMRDCCMWCSKSNWFCILSIQYVLATRCTSSTWVIRLFSFRLCRSLACFFCLMHMRRKRILNFAMNKALSRECERRAYTLKAALVSQCRKAKATRRQSKVNTLTVENAWMSMRWRYGSSLRRQTIRILNFYEPIYLRLYGTGGRRYATWHTQSFAFRMGIARTTMVPGLIVLGQDNWNATVAFFHCCWCGHLHVCMLRWHMPYAYSNQTTHQI